MITSPDRRVREAWEKWLSVTRGRCHIQYRFEGHNLAEHIAACFGSAQEAADRIRRDLGDATPRRILDVGCSVGFNCFALAHRYPEAAVVGLEPDPEAAAVAHAMGVSGVVKNVVFIAGVGERLPFPDGAFDLIVCHTVIEHVASVAEVIGEMPRVLSPSGAIHLEAPNYTWPREPHLEMWCVPLLVKQLLRPLPILQGKGPFSAYLDHLQLVTPRHLERLFRQHGLAWESHVPAKLRMVVDGTPGVVKAYRGLASVLQAMRR